MKTCGDYITIVSSEESFIREQESLWEDFLEWLDEPLHQEAYFEEYLLKDTYAYDKLLKLFADSIKNTFPTDPQDLGKERFLVLLNLMKSQDDILEDFQLWVYDRLDWVWR